MAATPRTRPRVRPLPRKRRGHIPVARSNGKPTAATVVEDDSREENPLSGRTGKLNIVGAAQVVAGTLGREKEDVLAVLEAYMTLAAEALKKNIVVSLPCIGTLNPFIKQATYYYNVNEGRKARVPKRRFIRLVVSQKMRAALHAMAV